MVDLKDISSIKSLIKKYKAIYCTGAAAESKLLIIEALNHCLLVMVDDLEMSRRKKL